MTFQQTDLPPYTLSLLRFFVRQFDDFSLVFGLGQLTSHDGKFLGVCLQHFGFDFQNGDITVKFMLHCHLRTIPVYGWPSRTCGLSAQALKASPFVNVKVPEPVHPD
jgi:hypothetical protein